MRVSNDFNMTVPINTVLAPSSYDPIEIAVEVWFKADNIASMTLDIILGLLPYKLRKKAGVAQI